MEQTAPIISRSEYNNVVNRPESPRTLPGHSYTNPAFFAAEIEHVFHKHWFPLAHEQMVPQVGDFYTIDLWDKKLVVIRGTDDIIRILDRRCLENGRDLFINPFVQGHCEEFLGNILSHRSWTYNLQGELIDASGLSGEQSTANERLVQYAMEIWHGFIFVNLDGQAEPYAPALTSMYPWLENYQLDDLKLMRQPVVFDMNANWKVIAENYIEAYHHLATHRNTFEKVSPACTTNTEDLSDNVVFLRMPIQQNFQNVFGGALPPIETLREADLNTFPVFLSLPLFLLTPLHNSVAWLHLIPVSPEKSLWMIYILAPKEYIQRKEHIKKLLHSGIDIHNEDMDACIGNQKGIRSRFFEQGYLHPTLEKGVWYFDRFLLQTLAESDPRLISE